MDLMKVVMAVAAILAAGVVAAATGWVVGGLAWAAVTAWRGTR